jgi:hypothetical protein
MLTAEFLCQAIVGTPMHIHGFVGHRPQEALSVVAIDPWLLGRPPNTPVTAVGVILPMLARARS